MIEMNNLTKRYTEKTNGCFKYDLIDHAQRIGEFNDYDAFFYYNMAVKRLGELEDALAPQPIANWHEDMGDCLWWFFPIQEAPYCGSPLDCDFPHYVTHFTKLLMPLNNESLTEAKANER